MAASARPQTKQGRARVGGSRGYHHHVPDQGEGIQGMPLCSTKHTDTVPLPNQSSPLRCQRTCCIRHPWIVAITARVRSHVRRTQSLRCIIHLAYVMSVHVYCFDSTSVYSCSLLIRLVVKLCHVAHCWCSDANNPVYTSNRHLLLCWCGCERRSGRVVTHRPLAVFMSVACALLKVVMVAVDNQLHLAGGFARHLLGPTAALQPTENPPVVT